MKRIQSSAAWCALLLLSLCTHAAAQPATAPSTAPVEGSKFLRFVPDAQGGGVLQTSIVTYRNDVGAAVDLIAAVHIADPQFFHDLDKRFKDYDALLYEMVKPKDYNPGQDRPATRPAASVRNMGWVGMVQRFMKSSLDLAFQLDEINYGAPNFVHADLDVDTFFDMQEDRGESMMSLMIQSMMNEMSRQNQGMGTAAPGVMDLITALQSPDRSRQLKLVLAKQFNQMDEMMSGLEGPNGSVIITERNKAALKVLRERIAKGDRKLGIFYGAGHLTSMEKTLIGQMGFKQVGEPVWITAWNMKAPTSQPATRPAP
jgi:hypothetical protein